MAENVREELRGRGVYFAFTGGCAALAAAKMTCEGVFFEDLGMAEAIWVFELDRLPLTVAIDAVGGDLYDVARKRAGACCDGMLYRR
jgi:fumarate hydratase subunit beta